MSQSNCSKCAGTCECGDLTVKNPDCDSSVSQDDMETSSIPNLSEPTEHVALSSGGKKIYKCMRCDEKFKSSRSLQQHESEHIKPHRCDQCKMSFAELHLLNSHKHYMHNILDLRIANHYSSEMTRFKCFECLEMFDSETDLVSHVMQHSAFKKLFGCNYCGKSFDNDCMLKRHHVVHIDIRPVECDVCKKCFKSEDNLKAHKRVVHLGVRTHHCFDCNMSFVTTKDLRRHSQTSKHKTKIAELKAAGTYVEPTSLENPLKCTECLLEFQTEQDFEAHLCIRSHFLDAIPSSSTTIHEDETLHACDECPKVFKLKDNLNKHKRFVHLAIRSHHCFECKLSFTCASKLQRHFQSLGHKNKVKEVQSEVKIKVEDLEPEQIT